MVRGLSGLRSQGPESGIDWTNFTHTHSLVTNEMHSGSLKHLLKNYINAILKNFVPMPQNSSLIIRCSRDYWQLWRRCFIVSPKKSLTLATPTSLNCLVLSLLERLTQSQASLLFRLMVTLWIRETRKNWSCCVTHQRISSKSIRGQTKQGNKSHKQTHIQKELYSRVGETKNLQYLLIQKLLRNLLCVQSEFCGPFIYTQSFLQIFFHEAKGILVNRVD